MKRIRFALLLIVILTMLFACSDKDKDTIKMPLKIGNTWTMLHTLHYYNPEISQMVTEIDTIHVEVTQRIESPNGEMCYRVEHWSSADPNQSIGYDLLVNREDGLYQLGWKLGYSHSPFKGTKLPFYNTPFSFGIKAENPKFEEVWLETPKKILPNKCEAGLYWTYGPNSHHLQAGYWIMPPEYVTVPLGRYKCHIRKTNLLEMEEPIDLFNSFAKIGPIKQSYETMASYTNEFGEVIGEYPFNAKMELISYKLK